MKRRTALLGAMCAPAVMIGTRTVQASTYPARSIRLVSPSPPGGAGDVSNRLLAQHLTQQLNQSCLIEYKLGGNGVVAAQEVLRSESDGYTIFLSSLTALVGNMFLMKSVPYDPVNDFVPISLIGTIPFVLVSDPNLPINSVQDLISYAKAKPGQVSFASANTTSLVAASMFARMTGIEMLNVPYKGAPASLSDITGGRVAVAFTDIPSARGLIQSGKLRLLGATSATRVPIFPDTPTIAESGVPGYELIGWTAMVARSGTDRTILQRLSAETAQALAKPEVRDPMADVGITATSSKPEELAEFLASERKKWAQLIRDAEIEPT